MSSGIGKFITTIFCASSMFFLSGCANPLVKKELTPELKGQIHIGDVEVRKLGTVKSAQVTNLVKTSLEKELDAKPVTNKPMNMDVTIEQYRGPEDLIGGNTTAKLLGVKMNIKALVKILDPSDRTVVAEYRVIRDYQQGGLLALSSGGMSTISFVDANDALMRDFTYFVLDQIY